MKQVIYVDVLVFLNTVITFLLLLASGRIMRLAPTPGRLVLASLVGGAASLLMLAPELGLPLSLLTKLLFSLIIVTAAFNPKTLGAILRQTGWFFSVNFIFAGIMLFISSLPGVSLIQYKNGVAYANFSVLSLTLASLMCYIITLVLNRITGRRQGSALWYDVTVECAGEAVTGKALLDTGLSLNDPFTGESVMVASLDFIMPILPENVKNYLAYGTESCSEIRLIPYKTISAEGLLPCFRAEKITVKSPKERFVLTGGEIAVSRRRVSAGLLLSPELLSNPERRESGAQAVR